MSRPSHHRPERRQRKAYRPARIDLDPVGLALSRAAKLTPEQRQQLVGPTAAAFEAFRTGRGTEPLWRSLADAMNVAEALAERGIASDHVDTFARAQAALAAVWQRHAAGGSWTLRGAEITALDDGAFVHGVQLEHASQGEVADAIAAVKRRMQGVRAGNVPKGAVVIGSLGVVAC